MTILLPQCCTAPQHRTESWLFRILKPRHVVNHSITPVVKIFDRLSPYRTPRLYGHDNAGGFGQPIAHGPVLDTTLRTVTSTDARAPYRVPTVFIVAAVSHLYHRSDSQARRGRQRQRFRQLPEEKNRTAPFNVGVGDTSDAVLSPTA